MWIILLNSTYVITFLNNNCRFTYNSYFNSKAKKAKSQCCHLRKSMETKMITNFVAKLPKFLIIKTLAFISLDFWKYMYIQTNLTVKPRLATPNAHTSFFSSKSNIFNHSLRSFRFEGLGELSSLQRIVNFKFDKSQTFYVYSFTWRRYVVVVVVVEEMRANIKLFTLSILTSRL